MARSTVTTSVLGVCKVVVAVAGVVTILGAAANAMGFRSSSPGRSIDAVNLRVDSQAARITRVEHRVDTLTTQQAFTNYLLCVQMRTTNPTLLPPDCAPIIQARSGR